MPASIRPPSRDFGHDYAAAASGGKRACAVSVQLAWSQIVCGSRMMARGSESRKVEGNPVVMSSQLRPPFEDRHSTVVILLIQQVLLSPGASIMLQHTSVPVSPSQKVQPGDQ